MDWDDRFVPVLLIHRIGTKALNSSWRLWHIYIYGMLLRLLCALSTWEQGRYSIIIYNSLFCLATLLLELREMLFDLFGKQEGVGGIALFEQCRNLWGNSSGLGQPVEGAFGGVVDST